MRHRRQTEKLKSYRRNSCDEKNQYPSPYLAWKQSNFRARLTHEQFSFYKCDHCHWWHLAHARDYD